MRLDRVPRGYDDLGSFCEFSHTEAVFSCNPGDLNGSALPRGSAPAVHARIAPESRDPGRNWRHCVASASELYRLHVWTRRVEGRHPRERQALNGRLRSSRSHLIPSGGLGAVRRQIQKGWDLPVCVIGQSRHLGYPFSACPKQALVDLCRDLPQAIEVLPLLRLGISF